MAIAGGLRVAVVREEAVQVVTVVWGAVVLVAITRISLQQVQALMAQAMGVAAVVVIITPAAPAALAS